MGFSTNFPAIKPSLLLDFANTKQLDPRITFTRATTATYYDGVTTAKAEENLLTFSEQFDNAAWLKFNVTVTANATTAPDGTTTAELCYPSSTGAARNLYRSVMTSGLQYAISIYAKAGGLNHLCVYDETGSGVGRAWFNLSTGAVGTVAAGYTASITDAGNGWYRCTVVRTVSGAFYSFGGTDADNSTTSTTSGTNGIYIWGAQLEQRSSVTAYTATTTQAITNYIPVLQTAASGVARFDHNPITDESLGLLIEEQRTNLFTRSEEFDNAAWTKTNSSIIANTIIAPDGTLTGDKVLENSTNTQHFVRQNLTVSAAAHTLSFYAKAAERTVAWASVDGGSNTRWFDLSAGTTGGSSGGSGSSTITLVGNGWYRCTYTYTFSGTSSPTFIGPALNSTTTSYAGDSFNGVYIWGAQLEAGAFPTSYIPTVAASVTRNADVAYLPVTGWYAGSGEATIYAEINSLNNAVDGNTIWFGLYGSTALTGGDDRGLVLYANYQFLSRNPTNTLPSAVWQAGNSKIAMAMDGSGKYISKNGGTVISTSGAGLNYIIGATVFSLSGSVGSKACSTLKKIAYYPIRVTNAHLQGLTTV
jgi:hypothetical protein